jgi:hypothetical protein
MLRLLAIFMSITLLLFQSAYLATPAQSAADPDLASGLRTAVASPRSEASASNSQNARQASSGTLVAAADSNSSSSSSQNSDQHWSKRKKIVAFCIFGCLVATAITLPIVLSCAGHHHNSNFSNNQSQVAWNLIRTRQLQLNPPPLPKTKALPLFVPHGNPK